MKYIHNFQQYYHHCKREKRKVDPKTLPIYAGKPLIYDVNGKSWIQ